MKQQSQNIVHQYMLPLLHLGWITLPLPLYYLLKKQYLDHNQMYLLIIISIQLLGLMSGGVLMQLIQLLAHIAFSLVLLELCVLELQEYAGRFDLSSLFPPPKNHHPLSRKLSVNRDSQLSSHRLQQPLIQNKSVEKTQIPYLLRHLKSFQKCKLAQTMIVLVGMGLWIGLHGYFTNSYRWGIGIQLVDGEIFKGFNQSLDGWNCTFGEFYVFPLFSLFILGVCYLMLEHMLRKKKGMVKDENEFGILIKEQCGERGNGKSEKSELGWIAENEYKTYLLAYLVKPSICIFFIQFIYSLIVKYSVSGLLQCYSSYFNVPIYFSFHFIMQWGLPIIIAYFFYTKSNKFIIQSETLSHHKQLVKSSSVSSQHGSDDSEESDPQKRQKQQQLLENVLPSQLNWEKQRVQSYIFKF